MKAIKKLLAVVLSIAMVLGTLTVTAQAADNVAEVTIDGTTTGYTTIDAAASAFVAGTGSSQTLKLLANVSYSTRLELIAGASGAGKKYTIDVNGFNFTYNVSKGLLVRGYDTLNIVDTSATQGGSFDFSGSNTYFFYLNKNASAINIDLGTSALKGASVTTWLSSAGQASPTPSIATGVFSLDPNSYATGTVTKTGENEWTVAGAPKVCEIVGGAQYETIDAAFAAAANGDTIKLIADAEKTTKVIAIAANKEITFDFNGYTLTNTFSGSTGTNARTFIVNNSTSTLNIVDSSAAKTGTFYANAGTTGGTLVRAESGGTVNISGGTFYKGTGDANLISRTTTAPAGVVNVTGGWWEAEVSDAQMPDGYGSVTVTEEAKAATPYTVSNTKKVVDYSKNAKDATGTVTANTVYYVDGYAITETKTKTNQFSYTDYTFMGWSTNSEADPDSPDLIAPGTTIDWTQYGDEITFFAIWKKVDKSMWVCVKTDNPDTGYADLKSAFDKEDDVTLIKNITDRTTISGQGRLNLNGYNIITTSTSGSALVINGENKAISIYNEDAGTITVDGVDYTFGGEGIVEGSATGTGGAIEASKATVKIYGGTFRGDAPNNGTVLTCSGTGSFEVYGGTFEPSDPTSTVSTYYANNGKIFVLADTQSDVKMSGTFAKNTSGTVGIQGGYFSELQPNAIVGTYDPVQGTFAKDDTKALVANTGDATYPYSVGATPWYITYNLDGGENDAQNPTQVNKNDETAITLQPATKAGYTFTGWTDADGNKVTAITGAELEGDLTLTANYEIITYTITYNNMRSDGVAPTQKTFTVVDNVILGTATRTEYYLTKWTEGSEVGGADITGWNAGEKTEDVNVWANWSKGEASVTIGESTVVYPTFAEAVAAVKDSSEAATLKLLKAVTVEARVDLGSQADLTLDLNGLTLTETTATNSGIIIYEGALTITGAGKMVDATKKSENYKSIVTQREGAKLTIESGTFEGFIKAKHDGSSTKPGAGVTITGGTFSFDPTNEVNTALYQVVEKDAAYTVYAAVAQVTVDETTTGYRYMKSSTATQSALDNVVEGSTLTLLKNATASYEFGSEITFTLDKNGFTYDLDTKLSAADGYVIKNTLVEGDVYTVAVTEKPATKAVITNAKAILGTQITFEYQVRVTPLAEDIGKYVTLTTKAGTQCEAQEITGEGTYTFTSTIDLVNLGTNVEPTVMLGDVTLATKDFSFVSYAKTLYETYKETDRDALMNLLADTLNVGSLLQAKAGKGTAFSVPSELQSYVGTATAADSVKGTTVGSTNPDLKIKSATLYAETQIWLVFRIYDPNHYNFKITVGDDDYTHADCVYAGDGVYDLRIALDPSQFGTTFEAQLFKTINDKVDGNCVHGVKYSANSYCTSKAGDSIADAIYNYGISANAYLN